MSNKVKKTVYTDGARTVLDPNTGEMHDFESNTYRITVEELFKEDEAEKTLHLFMENTTYIRSFRGNGILLNQHLTPSEISMLIFLNDFVCYDDCVLRENGDKKKKPLTIKDVSSLIGLKYDTVRKTMHSLKQKQVLAYHSSGDYKDKNNKYNDMTVISCNPYIFCRGMYVDDFIRDYFSDSIWAKYPRQKKRVYGIDD